MGLAQRFRIGKFLPGVKKHDPEYEQTQRLLVLRGSAMSRLMEKGEFQAIVDHIKEREEEIITKIQTAKDKEKLTGLGERLDELRSLIPSMQKCVLIGEAAQNQVRLIEQDRLKRREKENN